MSSRNVVLGLRLLGAYTIYSISCVVGAGAAATNTTTEVLTRKGDTTAALDAVAEPYAFPPAPYEVPGQTTLAAEPPVQEGSVPPLTAAKAPERRRQRNRHVGRGATAARYLGPAARHVERLRPFATDVAEEENEGTDVLAPAAPQTEAAGQKNDAALTSGGQHSGFRGPRNGFLKAPDSLRDSRFQPQADRQAAGAAGRWQKASPTASEEALWRALEDIHPRAHRAAVNLSLRGLVTTVVVATVLGALLTAGLTRRMAAAPASRLNLGASGKEPPADLVVPHLETKTLVATLVHIIPVLIIMWSPASALMFLTYWVLNTVLANWDRLEAQYPHIVAQPKRAAAKWLQDYLQTS